MKRDMREDKQFFMVGINFEKADAETRGKFTFFTNYIDVFVKEAQKKEMEHFFIVSTCNRSEFYAWAESAEEMIELYCRFTKGNADLFKEYAVVKKGDLAVNHLFRVSSGLESQTLGDFEIIGQIKIWFNYFRKAGSTNAFLERLMSTAIQISKKVKNETALSDGAASVAYTAVNYIQSMQDGLAHKNILLYGIGEIGRNTCENLIKHSPSAKLTLINRTKEKADVLGLKYQVKVKEHSELEEELKQTDVLIVATAAQNYMITEEMIPANKEMTIIDMSVPENVSPNLGKRARIQLVNVDGLSKMVDATLAQREEEIPKAEVIIKESSEEFYEWLENRAYVPYIRSFKQRLEFLQQNELHNLKKDNQELELTETVLTDKLVQKITNQFASYIIENREEADETIELISKMFHLKEVVAE